MCEQSHNDSPHWVPICSCHRDRIFTADNKTCEWSTCPGVRVFKLIFFIAKNKDCYILFSGRSLLDLQWRFERMCDERGLFNARLFCWLDASWLRPDALRVRAGLHLGFRYQTNFREQHCTFPVPNATKQHVRIILIGSVAPRRFFKWHHRDNLVFLANSNF